MFQRSNGAAPLERGPLLGEAQQEPGGTTGASELYYIWTAGFLDPTCHTNSWQTAFLRVPALPPSFCAHLPGPNGFQPHSPSVGCLYQSILQVSPHTQALSLSHQVVPAFPECFSL